MNILIALMVVAIIALYFIYKKLVSILTLFENEIKYNQAIDDFGFNYGVKDWLYLIFHRFIDILADAKENLTNIDYALNYDNPAGDNSAESKRICNLTRLYAEYLVNNENLSQYEAESKASFEFAKFNNEDLVKIINGISSRNWNEKFAKKKEIEKAFFDTGLLEKDCVANSQNLIPHDVFEPVWDLFKKQMYAKSEGKVLKIDEYKDSYSEYVKSRCIILKLLELEIITKVMPDSPDKYWLLNPTFQFLIDDLDKIRSIVYMGKSSHDDDYFESMFSEGRLTRRFKRKIW